MQLIRCARAIAGLEERRDFAFAVDGERIVAAGAYADVRERYPHADRRDFSDDVIVAPGFVNGHSHAYQILIRGRADDLPFERWRSEHLYDVVPRLTPEDVYGTFRRAFEEMLAEGITTVAEFFYLNAAGNAHAEHAIAAARDSGIRLVFARTWMDAEYAPAAFRESVETARTRTAELLEKHPEANVCVAPHSLHAASPEMVRSAAEFAREHACAMHVHVAEAPYEGAQTRERFGVGPIELLAQLGALSERTVAVHAIHIGDSEKSMLAEAGARVVHNPVTNQYLGDGICDVKGLRDRGVPVALGTDADVKPSILDEMRAAALLQKVAHLDAAAFDAGSAYAMATSEGARALALEAGDLRAGAFADFVCFEARLVDAWSPATNALVYRATGSWVRQTFVGGKPVHQKNM